MSYISFIYIYYKFERFLLIFAVMMPFASNIQWHKTLEAQGLSNLIACLTVEEDNHFIPEKRKTLLKIMPHSSISKFCQHFVNNVLHGCRHSIFTHQMMVKHQCSKSRCNDASLSHDFTAQPLKENSQAAQGTAADKHLTAQT